MKTPARHFQAERGYAMAALLVFISVMALMLSMAMPTWRTMAQREKEAELMFRGQQYARAVAKYQSARGSYPPSVDELVTQKFLRKKYKDPITGDDFDVIHVGQPTPGQTQQQGARQPGQPASTSFQPMVTAGLGINGGPVLGVVSKSTATSLMVVNGKSTYNEITFVPTAANTQAGTGATGTTNVGGVGGTNRPGGGAGAGANRPGGPAGQGQGQGQRQGGATPMPSIGQPMRLPPINGNGR